LKVGNVDAGKVKLHPTTAEKIDVTDGNLCMITFETTWAKSLLEAEIDNKIDEDSFIVRPEISIELGDTEGFGHKVEKYIEPLRDIKRATLKIESLENRHIDVNRFLTDRKHEVILMMKDKIIHKQSRIANERLGIDVLVEDIQPQLQVGEFARFSDDLEIILTREFRNVTYNSIILLDVTSTMFSEEPAHLMDNIENEAFYDRLCLDPITTSYIENYIRGKSKITRVNSAFLSILAFLYSKMGRGLYDKIGIIAFSDQARPITFNENGRENKWFSAINNISGASEIIEQIMITPRSEHTNFEAALIAAAFLLEEMEDLERQNNGYASPTIIILITDGQRTTGKAPVPLVKKIIEKKSNVVFHCIGLGSEVENEELEAIARTSGGTYLNTSNAYQLVKYLDNKAYDFSTVAGPGPFEKIFMRLKDLKQSNENVQEQEINIDNNQEVDIIGDWYKLPFSHGIEMELQVVTTNGTWLPGNRMRSVFRNLINQSYSKYLQLLKDDQNVPEIIRKKISGFEIKEDKAKNKAVHTLYETPDDGVLPFSIIGKDSHVSVDTNILEIQTPPCTHLEELEWWLHKSFTFCNEILNEMGLAIISTGMNHMEDFSKGVTFSDNHHIGIDDQRLRAHCYNMIRNFSPQIIGLTVNSPIYAKKIPDIRYNPNKSIVAPLSSLSIRLEKNTGQLSLPPPLGENSNTQDFLEKVGRSDEHFARMVDIYPFTRFGTIEVRFCDAQLSIASRVSVALLLQLICSKTQKLCAQNELPPIVDSNILYKNREFASKSGLLAPFRRSQEFDDYITRHTRIDRFHPKKGYYTQDAAHELMLFIKDEIPPNNDAINTFYNLLFLRIVGPQSVADIGPPITPAQYVLYLLKEKCQGNLDVLNKYLMEINAKCISNPRYDPILDALGLPFSKEIEEIEGVDEQYTYFQTLIKEALATCCGYSLSVACHDVHPQVMDDVSADFLVSAA